MASNSTKTTHTDILGFEAKLFLAADKLRGNIDSSEYKHVVLGLVFLKYISDAFNTVFEKLRADEYADEEDAEEYLAERTFWVPKDARWGYLQANAKQPSIARTRCSRAMTKSVAHGGASPPLLRPASSTTSSHTPISRRHLKPSQQGIPQHASMNSCRGTLTNWPDTAYKTTSIQTIKKGPRPLFQSQMIIVDFNPSCLSTSLRGK